MDKYSLKPESVNAICRHMYEAIALSSQFAFNLEQKEMYDELDILKRQTSCCFKVLSETINMLEMGKYNNVNPKVFDINEFVEDIVSACRSRLRKTKIKLLFEPSILSLHVEVDPERFAVCFLNILVNSLANIDREEGEVKISVKPFGRDAMLQIIDNGYGMSVQKATEYINDKDSFSGFAVLKRFCDTFGVSYIFETSQNGGFAISLKFPLSSGSDFNSSQVTLNEGTFSPINMILSKLDFVEIDALY
ncbi:MAG: HAMP domain-containing histidine kinase [Oscillospiraceae bacterium]|nr:HAMP domain-containing histidine kinase [Oscillospiraceae bacterium]